MKAKTAQDQMVKQPASMTTGNSEIGASASQEISEVATLSTLSTGKSEGNPALLDLLGRGFSIFPVHGIATDGKCDCGNPNCSSMGKHPMISSWQQLASSNPEQIEKWSTQYPGSNWGISTEQLVVLDIDGENSDETYAELSAKGLDGGLVAKTGGGGYHLYFKKPNFPVGNSVKNVFPNVDIRAKGGLTVAPGSIHASGMRYEWLPDQDGKTPGPLPDWIAGLLRKPVRKAPNIDGKDLILDGERNNKLFSMGMGLRKRAKTENEISAVLHRANETRCEPPLDAGEVENIISNVMKTDIEDSDHNEDIVITDLRNAASLAEKYRPVMRFCTNRKRFYINDGVCWIPDDTGELFRMAKTVVEETLDRGANTSNGQIAHAESRFSITNMIELVKWEPGIPLKSTAFDPNHLLLNVPNGTLDLRTGELRPHTKTDLITRLAPVAYDANETAPVWDRFLKDITCGDDDLAAFIQTSIGYGLTAETSEQVFFILNGAGANGKSTLLNTIRVLLGDYALQTPATTLLASKSDSTASNGVARLEGSRFVIASETGEGRKLDEALIKSITGGDAIAAREVYEKIQEFVPVCKLYLATNHLPRITDVTHSIWRRIIVIPFNAQFDDDTRDKDLPSKLMAELPGILNWAVQGCLKWQREGLRLPASVIEASKEYREESDTLQEFIKEKIFKEKGAKLTSAILHEEYSSWCKANSENPLSQVRFSKMMEKRSFKKRKNGNVEWLGIRLKKTEDYVAEEQQQQQQQDGAN